MNLYEFERLFIKLLFTNEVIRKKIQPYLTDKIFDTTEHQEIIQKLLKFVDQYNKFPSISEFKMQLTKEDQDNFSEIILKVDSEEYDRDFLFEKLEEFFKSKLIHNSNVDIALALAENKLGKISDYVGNISEYLGFNFDTVIGTDLLEDAATIYDKLVNKDNIISTGIPTLDEILAGGFHEKTLSLFLAETNLGKSLIMASLATNCLMNNKKVLIITLEMSEQKYSQRIFTNLLDIDIRDFKNISKEKFVERVEQSKKSISSKLIIKEYPPKTVNINHIKNLLIELKNKKNFEPDIIFIDYLEIMNSTGTTKNDNSFSEMKKISENIRGLAVEYKIPIVSGVQTIRSAIGSAEINMTDTSQSIGIAQTTDVMIGVTQPEEFKRMAKFIWFILKNRDGTKNRKVIVDVDYYKMRVTEDPEANKEQTMPTVAASEVVKNSLKKDDAVAKKKSSNWE
jgi:replicative DNA helicase